MFPSLGLTPSAVTVTGMANEIYFSANATVNGTGIATSPYAGSQLTSVLAALTTAGKTGIHVHLSAGNFNVQEQSNGVNSAINPLSAWTIEGAGMGVTTLTLTGVNTTTNTAHKHYAIYGTANNITIKNISVNVNHVGWASSLLSAHDSNGTASKDDAGQAVTLIGNNNSLLNCESYGHYGDNANVEVYSGGTDTHTTTAFECFPFFLQGNNILASGLYVHGKDTTLAGGTGTYVSGLCLNGGTNMQARYCSDDGSDHSFLSSNGPATFDHCSNTSACGDGYYSDSAPISGLVIENCDLSGTVCPIQFNGNGSANVSTGIKILDNNLRDYAPSGAATSLAIIDLTTFYAGATNLLIEGNHCYNPGGNTGVGFIDNASNAWTGITAVHNYLPAGMPYAGGDSTVSYTVNSNNFIGPNWIGTTLSTPALDARYQAPLTLTTTGTSGAATLSGNTLNIPQYQGGVTSFDTRTGAVTLQLADVGSAVSGITGLLWSNGAGTLGAATSNNLADTLSGETDALTFNGNVTLNGTLTLGTNATLVGQLVNYNGSGPPSSVYAAGTIYCDTTNNNLYQSNGTTEVEIAGASCPVSESNLQTALGTWVLNSTFKNGTTTNLVSGSGELFTGQVTTTSGNATTGTIFAYPGAANSTTGTATGGGFTLITGAASSTGSALTQSGAIVIETGNTSGAGTDQVVGGITIDCGIPSTYLANNGSYGNISIGANNANYVQLGSVVGAQTDAPAVASGAGVGSGGSVAATSSTSLTNLTCEVTVVQPASNSATGTVFTITSQNYAPNALTMTFSPANAAAAALTGATAPYVGASTRNTVTLHSGATAMPAGTYQYLVQLGGW